MSNPSSATWVCFALKEESAPFETAAAGRPGLSVFVIGIGRANAEKNIRAALDASPNTPELVLTCGFAGGLDPELAINDVVFEADEGSAIAARLLAAGARPARFHCAPRIAVTAHEKKELRDATGADAVEMESEAVHAVCRERGIPCATVRVVSDTADEDLPMDFNQFTKPDLSLDHAKLMQAIGRSPLKIPALMRLQRQTKAAAAALAEVLVKITAA